MLRKVNLVGTGTLTISLPSNWIERLNIRKGDELDVIEKDEGSLVISKNIIQNEKKIKYLEVSGLSIFLEKYIAGFYKSGFDKLEVKYSSPEELKIIQDLLEKTCIGFDIIEHDKNNISIEIISEIDIEEFDKIFRRNLVTMELISLELAESIANKDIPGIKTCILKHHLINKYSDYLRRCLNKYPTKFKNIGPKYTAIELLEMIADLYRSISEDIVKYDLKLSNDLQKILTESNDYFILMKEIFYKYDKEKMRIFIEKKKNFNKNLIPNNLKLKPNEIMIFLYLKSIIQIIYDFNGLIMTMNS
ncbi:MAG: AbrB/MazE/SpoVT family DNA-binding domain-containing protein [Candidatus Pacearchaeota archaeon]|jgi:phosphate uptake regulator